MISYAFAALFLIPIFWMAVNAFKPENTTIVNLIEWLKPPFTLENFHKVLYSKNANIGLWILNSAAVSFLSTVGVLFLCTLAAFSFSRMRFFGQGLWYWLIMAGLMVPREATLIPLYMLFRDWGLLNTYFSLIAPTVAAPFGLIIMKQFFDGLPNDLFEAAKIDGCGWARTMFTIAVPLCRPALASLGIFSFMQAWNDFLWPFISVTDPKIMTIPVGLPVFKSQYMTEQALPMAASALTSIPILVIFFIFQKYIVKGISFTGGK
jgi:multiple sugar transport system permease protein